MISELAGGVRLATTLLTVVPVGTGRVDREIAGRAMIAAPAVGVVVGAAAALVLVLGEPLGLGGALRAALAVASIAALTRALHLDGLADLADGLGSRRPPAESLEIMRRSDIGPFGVVTLLLTLLVQVTALAESDHPVAAVVVAAITGRLVLPWACRAGVPAARPDGLGALVAGTVPAAAALTLTGVVAVGAAVTGWLLDGPRGGTSGGLAVIFGVGGALLVLAHANRRLGGVTGDVLGALVEVGTTVALVTLAAG